MVATTQYVVEGEKTEDGLLLMKQGSKFCLWKDEEGYYFVCELDGSEVKEFAATRTLSKALKAYETFEQVFGNVISDWAEMPTTGIVYFIGARGGGKTALVWERAEKISAATGKPVAALLPESDYAKEILPSWVTILTSASQVKQYPGYIIIADEMALQANARDSNSEDNKEWTKTVAIIRQLDILLLLVSQHTRQMDVQLAMDVDWLVFKAPSVLHVRMARAELKPEVEAAFQEFELQRREIIASLLKSNRSVTHEAIKKHLQTLAYVVDVHNARAGMLKNGLASFWNDKISIYFGTVAANS